MVELCELKLMSNGVDCWPPDIDQHVAQLDFGDHSTTSINGQSSLFASIQLDPSVISTDSMDMETFNLRCENNKNDYKLTNFEDSGQWTTSGIGTSLTTAVNNSPPNLQSAAARRNHILKRLQMFDVENGSSPGSILTSNSNQGNNHHFGLALLEQLNQLDLLPEEEGGGAAIHKNIMENLLNHNYQGGGSGGGGGGGFTTWGRLVPAQQLQPPFEEKTYSLPELAKGSATTPGNHQQHSNCHLWGGGRPVSLPPPPPAPVLGNNNCSSTTSAGSGGSRTRPGSLLANFVGQHQQQQQLFETNLTNIHSAAAATATPSPATYQYGEVYLGEGRYVDVNENEIGFVPENTAAIQRGAEGDRWHSPQRNNSSNTSFFPPGGGPGSRYAQAVLTLPAATANGGGRAASSLPRVRPQRTFADLSPSQTAPDLKFLSMSHKVPNLCRSSMSLDGMLKKAREGVYLTDCGLEDEKILLFEGGQTSSSHQMSTLNNGPDSGLGSSSSSGPLHIEDWPSLATLLPKQVVDACSFFKTNASLLTGSSEVAPSTPSNNIERKPTATTTIRGKGNSIAAASGEDGEPCRTCFSVRRRHCLPPPNWAQPPNKRVLCDCAAVGGDCCCLSCPTDYLVLPSSSAKERRVTTARLKLHAQELSIVGLPIYETKRNLVERVVEGVAEIARGASSVVLWSALERLLADGLVEGNRPWQVIVQITGPGPATNNIFQLVKTLEASEKPEYSRIQHFFREILKLNSLEGWLSYVVLKENILGQLYTDTAFLVRATSAYRSLFWRLVESVELLSVLSQCHHKQVLLLSASQPNSARWWGGCGASRLPSDSRVPKSSSMPITVGRMASGTGHPPPEAAAPTIVVEKEVELERRPSLLAKAVENREAEAKKALRKESPRPSTSSTLSRIPTIVSPTSSTHCYGGRSTPSRSSSQHQPSKSRMLSPATTPIRSRSLLRKLGGGEGSRIPVRVLGSPSASS